MRRLVPLLSLLLPACSIEINLGEGATTGSLPDIPGFPDLPDPPEPIETSTGGDEDGGLPVPPMDLPGDGGCDPLDPYACPYGLECLPDVANGSLEGFVCQESGGGPSGDYADPCACKFCCDAGFMCAPQSAVGPACTTGTCCTPLCDLLAPDCPHPDQACVPLLAANDLAYPDLGTCRITD